MARPSGSSSRSTKRSENKCPMCSGGRLDEAVVSMRLRGVLVTGLIGHRCDSCGEVVIPMSEGDRAKKIADLKLSERERNKAA